MGTFSAESVAKDAFVALRAKNYTAAAELFRHALSLDRQRSRRTPEMRYLSYYGLCLASAGLSQSLALEACKRAVARQKGDPILHLNLGRVYRMAGKPTLALKAFETGLAEAPDHRMLVKELAAIDRRSKPPIAFLSRSHPLNEFLGRRRKGRAQVRIASRRPRPIRGVRTT